MKALKKIWDVVSTVLVVLIVLCAVFLMGSRLLGYEVYTIISGSMEPTYMVGDLVYVDRIYTKDINAIQNKEERSAAIQEKIAAVQAEVDSGDLKVGDAISFVLNENLVVATHTVVEIDEENHKIYTKGDANDIVDGDPVLYENVIGVVEFSLPMLGYVSDFIQNPPGTYITIAAGAVLIILVFLPDFVPKKKPQEEAAAAEPVDQAVIDENEKLTAELEALKAQLNKETPPTQDQ